MDLAVVGEEALRVAGRREPEWAGKPMGGNAMLIAAHAKSLGYKVGTDNLREFSRIEGLNCENWLKEE